MRFKFSFLLFSWSITTTAQATRTNIIEHFTNTLCSTCASRNPGFYSVMSNCPQVLHVAYDLSFPYTNCAFNQQIVTENDGRTC